MILAFTFWFYFITNDKRGNIFPQIYECLIIKVSCDENKLMMLFPMKMMGILEKCLCLWMSRPWLRGSEVDTILSMCYVLWPRLTIVSLVKTLIGIMVDWINIWDQYSLRIWTLTRTNRHNSSTLIQDKNGAKMGIKMAQIWMQIEMQHWM